MNDDQRKHLNILLAQAQATAESLRALGSDATFDYSSATFRSVNSLISEAREALEGTVAGALVPQVVNPIRLVDYAGVGDLLVAVSSLAAAVGAAKLEEDDGEAVALREQVDALEAKLTEAEARSAYIVDDELKDRCLDLLVRPGKADTAVRDAAVVLEHRIRKAAGLGPEDYGVGLVDKALSPKTGLLDFGGPKPEREGIHQLYRGVIAFFKNPTSHQIIQDYDVTRARQVVGLIDLLLQLLRDAKRKEPTAQTGETATPRA